jgi:hypothetical protein
MIKLQILYEEEDLYTTIDFPKIGGQINNLRMKIKEEFPKLSGNFLIIKDDKVLNDNSNLKFNDNDFITIRDDKNNEANIPVSFIDITNEKNKVNQEVEKDDNEGIDKWRTVMPGLNFVGVCPNDKCNAYNKTVYNCVNASSFCYNFDFIESSGLMKCPECNYQFKSDNICFYQCYYNFYGEKIKKNKTLEEFGKEISDFENIDINDDNTVNINGESYHIYKTKPDNIDYFYSEENEKVMFIKLIFQIKML